MPDSEFVRHYIDLIAVNIRRLRGAMSQEEFAKKVGVARTTVSRMEGRRNFEIRSLIKIAEAFGLYPFDLCMTEEERARVRADVERKEKEIEERVTRNVLAKLQQ